MMYRNNNELAERYIDGDTDAFEKLIVDNMGLVKSTARRFIGRGTDFDDLVQIGSVGLIKAAKAFDPKLGYEFSTYAFSMITGELRRHFRDDGLIKVSRGIKKNCALMLKLKEEYISSYGIEPHISYLAEKCGIDTDEAILCLDALSPVESMNTSCDGEKTIEERTGENNIEEFIERYSLKQAISQLSREEQLIIAFRYGMSMTQSETAKRLGYTQVRISRTEKKIMEKLKTILS